MARVSNEAAVRFWDACQSKDVLIEDINLAAVFQALAASYGAMIEARSSLPDTPQKLHGQLKLPVNDEWAITDAGLESKLRAARIAREIHQLGCCLGFDTER